VIEIGVDNELIPLRNSGGLTWVGAGLFQAICKIFFLHGGSSLVEKHYFRHSLGNSIKKLRPLAARRFRAARPDTLHSIPNSKMT